MKLKYNAKMKLFLLLLTMSIFSFACSSAIIDKNAVPNEETTEYNTDVAVSESPNVIEEPKGIKEDISDEPLAEDTEKTDVPEDDRIAESTAEDQNENDTLMDNTAQENINTEYAAVDDDPAKEPETDIVIPEELAEEPQRENVQTEENTPKEKSKTQKTKIADKTIRKFVKNLEKTTDIHTICVYTKDNAEVISRETYVDCTVYTLNCDEEYKLIGNEAGIRVRGNSTAYGGNVSMIRKNQVPYRIKFSKKTNMLGLNDGAECKSWVLVKAEYDLLKNDIAFRLGRTILHEDNYCSDGTLVHVYLNGVFKGVYELCEQSQVNKHRINIPETPKDYTGTDIAYLVEIDNYGEKPCFSVNYNGAAITDINGAEKKFKAMFYSVKSDVYSDAQTKYIKNYVNNVFKVLYEACENGNYYFLNDDNNPVAAKKKKLKVKDENGNLKDPAEVVAESVLDLDSVVDLYLVYEIAKDRDVGEGSFYMYADFSADSTDHRLTFTCPWDFEWAYEGSALGVYAGAFNPDSFAEIYEERSNPWFVLLMKQDWFVERVRKRWEELRTPDEQGIDPISRCMQEEKELLQTYKNDLARQGSNACKKAEALISWTEKRLRWLDGWLMDDKRDQT